ncbi:type IV pilus modification protein PilV [Dyella solisilvae]|nr:type IV pilus modification protein PilV [Dyella solisilvae]
MGKVSRQRGVSLIEVLMAVLIFSVGLIGVAGLLVMAARSNHAAYLRTQVTFLAGNMADRMRANPQGVWTGAYNASSYPTSSKQSCTNTSACTPAQLAVRDQYMWSQMLTNLLPVATASISCTGADAMDYNPSGQLGARPPYGGNCEMTISWSERHAGDASHSDAAQQTFAWEFQP